jgi:hypothetical protein
MVRYVVKRLKGSSIRDLTPRARQVFDLLQKRHGATAPEIQKALRVTSRNVIAGAMHKLRQAKLVASQELAGGNGNGNARSLATSAAESPPPRQAGTRQAAGKPNGHVTFTRDEALTILKHVSVPRMLVWQALDLPKGPRNVKAKTVWGRQHATS